MVERDRVFGLPIWLASLLVVALFGYWLIQSVRSRKSLHLGLMPQFERDTQPFGYWTAVGVASAFFLVGLLSFVVPDWITHLPGQR